MFMTWIFATSQSFSFLFARFFCVLFKKPAKRFNPSIFQECDQQRKINCQLFGFNVSTNKNGNTLVLVAAALLVNAVAYSLFNTHFFLDFFKRSCVFILFSMEKSGGANESVWDA